MDQYPEGDLGDFFRVRFRNQIAKWHRDRGVPFVGWWTRENYLGFRREHIHLTLALDPALHVDLEAFIRRCFPGSPEMVHFGSPERRVHPDGTSIMNSGLEYRLKQKDHRAAWRPAGKTRHRRETSSRHDHAPVAPVVGKKVGWTKALDPLAAASRARLAVRRMKRKEQAMQPMHVETRFGDELCDKHIVRA